MAKALVPESFDEFRSVKFWDGFFKERGQQPFEWYGDWRQLKSYFAKDCQPGKEVLVVGCGNSDLSADLYDSGCQQITNVDFSKLVVANMMRKNLRKRPNMKWKVGDMTDLKFPDESFQVILDKGGLDALMGEESAESLEAGQKLLVGVSRIASAGGVYLCVTLAQSQVLGLLLKHFKRGWLLEIHPVPPSPDMARSPLQPVFVRAEKLRSGQQSGRSNVCSIMRSPRAPNAEQLEEICQTLEAAARSAIEETNGSRSVDNTAQDSFDDLHPGRRLAFSLPYKPEDLRIQDEARFNATVLDVTGSAEEAAGQKCCVFMIPQGRESEWLFASEEGQWQLAGQCRSNRVILIALGRKHQFSTSSAVQSELSPLVVPLAPLSVRGVQGAIPIMTTQEGIGKRRVVIEVLSSISGKIVVEDLAIEIEGQTEYKRRMIFVDNSNLVQSEACLVPKADATASSGVPPPNRKKAVKSSSSNTAFPQLELDHSSLAMDYHKHIVGGIIASSNAGVEQGKAQCTGLIIGLGGGGLPVFLSRFLAIQTLVIELDGEVNRLAGQYFGCSPEPGLQINAADGLEAIKNIAPASLDALVVDAGSNDASLSVSCPPAPFLEQTFLESATAALKAEGLLAINCVTRSESAFKTAVQSIQAVFPHARYTEVEDDVNRIIFAAKGNNFDEWSSRTTIEHVTSVLAKALDSEQRQNLAEEVSCIQLKPLPA